MARPARNPASLPSFGDRRAVRIGLYGGSFNPAHQGHEALAKAALTHLNLDQVWLIVSPGNPLKSARELAPYPIRVKGASLIADGRRIVATDLEERWHLRYSIDTIRRILKRFPRGKFVWIMGADSFASLPRWRCWKALSPFVSIAVFPRPGANMLALRGQAASFLRHHRKRSQQGRLLAGHAGPAWTFLLLPQIKLSSTELRFLRHNVKL